MNSENNSGVLTPRNHIRLRPGMYIGGTDSRALHSLVYQIIGHMVEEVLVNRCNYIWIELHNDNEILLRDNSLGISVAQVEDTALTEIEALIQIFRHNSGSLFNLVGVAVVAALSEKLTVQNRHNGFLWEQTYHQGLPQTPLLKTSLAEDEPTGTTFIFKPDYSIFERHDFELAIIEQRVRELAYQLPELKIAVTDLRTTPTHQSNFHYPDGLKTLVNITHEGAKPLHEIIHIREKVVIPRTTAADLTVEIEIAFQFSDSEALHLFTYVNTIEVASGIHVTALKAGLLACLNEHLENHTGEAKHKKQFTWAEISKGLTAAITIFHPTPHFMNSMKWDLGNKEIFGPITGSVFNAINYETAGYLVKHYLTRRKLQRKMK